MGALPRAILALIVMSLIWGYNWVLVKEAMRLAAPFDFSAIRTIGGGVLLLGVLAWQGKPLRPGHSQDPPGGGSLHDAFRGVRHLGPRRRRSRENGDSHLCHALLADPDGLAAPGERPKGLQWPAVALSLAGLVLLLEPWSYRGDLFPSTLAVASGLAWAASAVVTKRMDRDGGVDPVSLSAWQVLFGGLFLAAAALVVPSAPIRWTPWMAGVMAYNVVLTSAVAILMWFYVLKVLPAGIAGLGSLATPVLGLFFAYALLGERFSLCEGWGGALIIAALFILVLQGLRNHRRP